jgi:BolA protein
MSRQARLLSVLTEALTPQHIELLNESNQHAGPGTETHYKLVLVSDAFSAKRPVARHQMVYGLCQPELSSGLHALAMHLYTPEEWEKVQVAPLSPACLGGSKHEQ